VIDEKLLAILACPVCKAPLRLEDQWLVCTKTEVRYPVEDDIPILLAERAEPRHPDEAAPAEPPGE
jgi:uncharacterized protein YbaR (Trm112 family)